MPFTECLRLIPWLISSFFVVKVIEIRQVVSNKNFLSINSDIYGKFFSLNTLIGSTHVTSYVTDVLILLGCTYRLRYRLFLVQSFGVSQIVNHWKEAFLTSTLGIRMMSRDDKLTFLNKYQHCGAYIFKWRGIYGHSISELSPSSRLRWSFGVFHRISMYLLAFSNAHQQFTCTLRPMLHSSSLSQRYLDTKSGWLTKWWYFKWTNKNKSWLRINVNLLLFQCHHPMYSSSD